MSTTQATKVNPNLLALVEAGTSPWLDLLRRSLVDGGELARMVAEDSLRGVTANGRLIAAQAAGDLRTLRSHDLPSERIELGGDAAAAVRALTQRIIGLPQGA
jgi:hypothetical protein